MNHKKPIIAAVACILLVLLLTLLLRSCPTAPDRPELYEDPNAIYIKTTGSTMKGGDYIAIPGFERLTVPSGSCTIGCNIYNPEKNNCYFVAVVSLDDGGEIYRSGLIPPGKAIYTMTLQQPLLPGEYQATLTYHCYTFDERKAPLNGATTHFILEVTE